jgi:hypothetical protein
LKPFPKTGILGQPANIMRHAFDTWIFDLFDVEFEVSNRSNVTTNGRLKLSQILRYALDLDTPEVPYIPKWLDFEGSPWALFQGIQSAPWYVLHLDVRRQADIRALMTGGRKAPTPNLDNDAPMFFNTNLSRWNSQVCLLYYRNPHSNRFYDDWTSLPTRVITPDDLVSEDLAISLEEVYTRWRATASAPLYDRSRVASIVKPNHDVELERRFGFRPRIVPSPFFQDFKKPGIQSTIQRFEALLRDWDRFNLDMLSGSLVVKGMAAVKVGDRLHYQREGSRRGVDYYVESVTQDFQAFSGWRTTLGVTRGQRHREIGDLLFDPKGEPVSASSVRAMGLIG